MATEGGLRKPEREAIKIDDPNFWNENHLDIELRRQFDVCHSCRRCFNLCDSFPKLFDLIDEAPSMELDTVESTKFKNVVSFENTIVWATLGLITESWPALTTCVIFGELGFIISWKISIICPLVNKHFCSCCG